MSPHSSVQILKKIESHAGTVEHKEAYDFKLATGCRHEQARKLKSHLPGGNLDCRNDRLLTCALLDACLTCCSRLPQCLHHRELSSAQKRHPCNGCSAHISP